MVKMVKDGQYLLLVTVKVIWEAFIVANHVGYTMLSIDQSGYEPSETSVVAAVIMADWLRLLMHVGSRWAKSTIVKIMSQIMWFGWVQEDGMVAILWLIVLAKPMAYNNWDGQCWKNNG